MVVFAGRCYQRRGCLTAVVMGSVPACDGDDTWDVAIAVPHLCTTTVSRFSFPASELEVMLFYLHLSCFCRTSVTAMKAGFAPRLPIVALKGTRARICLVRIVLIGAIDS